MYYVLGRFKGTVWALKRWEQGQLEFDGKSGNILGALIVREDRERGKER